MYTIEEKYKYLCSMLKIAHVDLWEKDALIEMPSPLYFQFADCPTTVDDAVISAMEI